MNEDMINTSDCAPETAPELSPLSVESSLDSLGNADANPTNSSIGAVSISTTSSPSSSNDQQGVASVSNPSSWSPIANVQAVPPRDPDHGPIGCYLVYETTAGGRLMLYYSEGPIPDNAVGFWCPGPTKRIQGFKFKQDSGRSELIKGIAGGDSNRRKYFIGWCQFCKLAKSFGGKVIQFIPATQGVAVDIYGYTKAENQPELLDLDFLTDISTYDAVAVMPKHHAFLKGVKSIAMTQFLELGNIAGATTLLN